MIEDLMKHRQEVQSRLLNTRIQLGVKIALIGFVLLESDTKEHEFKAMTDLIDDVVKVATEVGKFEMMHEYLDRVIAGKIKNN